MARTSGHVSLHCFIGSPPNSARHVGSSGWTPASRRQNGVGRRRRSCSIWLSSCPHSGEPSRQSSAGLQHSAWSTMSTYCKWIELLQKITFQTEELELKKKVSFLYVFCCVMFVNTVAGGLIKTVIIELGKCIRYFTLFVCGLLLWLSCWNL